jgi:hypothetical protein
MVLGAILLFDVWYRAHTFGPIMREQLGLSLWPVKSELGEPLDCDESAYAYMGRRMLRGDVLYRDLTENKPPLGYWLYTAAVALGGANELTIRLMPIPYVLATIALLWWIGFRLSGPVAACLAAGLYSLGSTDPYLFGNGSNLEHFINFFAVASLALMVAAMERPGRMAAIALAGAFLGCAALVKQVAVTHLLVFAGAVFFRLSLTGGVRSVGRRVAELAALGAGFCLPWLVALLVLVLQGAGAEAYDDIVRYGGALVTDTPPDPHAPPWLVRWFTGNADPEGKLPPPFGKTDYLVWWGSGTWPLWLVAVPATAWLLFGRSHAARRIVALWTLSAWLQVGLPRLFWQHYYLLPLPGIAVVVAVFVVDAFVACRQAFRAGRSARGAWWGLLLFGALAGIVYTGMIQEKRYLFVEPPELAARYKGGGQWIVLRDMGGELGRRARICKLPHLFIWGWQSPLFIYSGLDSVTPHFFADPLLKAFAGTNHPLIQPRIARIMHDVRSRRPELIFAGDPPFPELLSFLIEDYRPVADLGPRRVMPITADGRGLWVERSSFERFKTAAQNMPPNGERIASRWRYRAEETASPAISGSSPMIRE